MMFSMKHMKPVAIAVIIALIISMMPLSLVPNEVNAQTYFVIGDLVINSYTEYEDDDIYVSGDVIISGDGVLVLKGTNLYMNYLSSDGIPSTLTVESDTSLILRASATDGSSITTWTEIGSEFFQRWNFTIMERATVYIEDSRIANINGGIYSQYDFTIVGSIVEDFTNFGLSLDGTNSPNGIIAPIIDNTVIDGGGLITTTTGVYLKNANAMMTKTTIQNCGGGYGLVIDNSNPSITDNTITDNSYGIKVINSTQPTILKNRILNNDFHGVVIYDSGSSSKPINFIENDIRGNGVNTDEGGWGFYAENSFLNIIKGNVSYNNAHTDADGSVFLNDGVGVWFNNVSGKIDNSEIFGNDNRGVYAFNSNLTITNSKIEDNRGDGLYYDNSNGEIKNNDINQNNNGIYTRDVTNELKIENNDIESNKQSGINLYDSYPIIENNRIKKHTTSTLFSSGIYINENSTVKIGNSTIEGNNIGIYIKRSIPTVFNTVIKDSKEDGVRIQTTTFFYPESPLFINSTIINSERTNINITDASITLRNTNWENSHFIGSTDYLTYIRVEQFLHVYVSAPIVISPYSSPVPNATVRVIGNDSYPTDTYYDQTFLTNSNGWVYNVVCTYEEIRNTNGTPSGNEITYFTPHNISVEKENTLPPVYKNNTIMDRTKTLYFQLTPTPDLIVNSIKLEVRNQTTWEKLATADDVSIIKKNEKVNITAEYQNIGNLMADELDVYFYFKTTYLSSNETTNLTKSQTGKNETAWTVNANPSVGNWFLVEIKNVEPYEVIFENNKLTKGNITIRDSNWVNALPSAEITSHSINAKVYGTIVMKGTANDSADLDNVKDEITYVKIKIGNYWYKATIDSYDSEREIYNWSYILDTTKQKDGKILVSVKSADGRDEGNETSINLVIDNINSISITKDISPTTVYENDTITVKGNAKFNDGKAVKNANVNIKITKYDSTTVESQTNTITDDKGNFSATIKAPLLKDVSTENNYKVFIKISATTEDEKIEKEVYQSITIKDKPVPILSGTIEVNEKIYFGDKITITAYIKNSGSATADARDVEVKFYVNDVYVGSDTIVRIAKGKTESATIDYTFNLTTGKTVIKAEFVSGFDLKTIIKESEVILGPDVKVEKITFEPYPPREGEDAKIIVSVKNIGWIDANNFTITLYVKDEKIEEKTKQIIKANATKEFVFIWNKPSMGDYEIKVEITDVEDETEKANNNRTAFVKVEQSRYWWLPFAVIGIIGLIVIISAIVVKFRKKKSPPGYIPPPMPPQPQTPQEPSPPLKQM